jgi:peptidoglycan hydrolase-like protein with peptidoglycan-binding domain
MRNVTEIQRELIALGYLRPGEDDGKFGRISLDAYNHWRASKGAPPVKAASMSQLNIDLFPEEQPGAKPRLTPNPVVQAIGAFAFRLLLNRLTKGLIPMNTNVDVISSWLSTKNWAAAIAIITNIAAILHIVIPPDLGPAVSAVVTSVAALYILVKNTWFTTTITAASAAKLK